MATSKLEHRLTKAGFKGVRSLSKGLLEVSNTGSVVSTNHWTTHNVDVADYGGFTALTNRLVIAGFLTKLYPGEAGPQQWVFIPGPKLKDCLPVKPLKQELAEIRQDLADTKQEITKIWAAIKHLEVTNPPVTSEKIQAHLTLVQP